MLDRSSIKPYLSGELKPTTMFKNLREMITTMDTQEKCRKYLASLRWPDGIVICPYCGHKKAYVIEGGKRYKCGSKECYQKFSVTVGTIFQDSNIPLTKWFMAVFLVTAHKKGISSYQLAKDTGVSQKCAWFMLHRMRELMKPKNNVPLDNSVEVDEVYIGGKVSNMSKSKRKMLHETGTVSDTKAMVMGMIERGGQLKLVPCDGDKYSSTVIQPVMTNNIDKDAVIMTDSSTMYSAVKHNFAGHETVNHREEEYVRDGVIHTNTIEGAFSHLKRSIFGIYHKVTVKHLSRYCEETAFRYNLRKMKDTERFTLALQICEGRLDYKTLVSAPGPKVEVTMEIPNVVVSSTSGKKVAVQQISNGKVIAEYPSIADAGRAVGIRPDHISRVLKGKRLTAAGYQWKYA
jgi:hypothetical protein